MSEKKDAAEPMVKVEDLPASEAMAADTIPLVNSESSGTPRNLTHGQEYDVVEVIQRVADNLPPVERRYTRRA